MTPNPAGDPARNPVVTTGGINLPIVKWWTRRRRVLRFLLGAFVVGGAAAITPGAGDKMAAYSAEAPALSPPLRSLLGARQWLNGEPLRPKDVQGKVVLVNFWTFPALTACECCPTFAPGPIDTKIEVWWWSAYKHQSLHSRKTAKTSQRRQRI